MIQPRPWQVWLADFGEPVGHEQGGVRPAVIVSTALHCRYPVGMVSVLPFTTRDRGLSHHVPVFSPDSGLKQLSFVRTEEIETMSTRRFLHDRPLGELVESERTAVRQWLVRHIDVLTDPNATARWASSRTTKPSSFQKSI